MSTQVLILSLLGTYYVISAHSLYKTNNLPAPAPNSTLDYLGRTLNGLELALEFFRREHRHVNLDSIIGTRIVEASFKVLLQRLEDSDLTSKVPPYVVSQLQHLRDKARVVSDMATPYIIANERPYYEKIGPIISEGLFELDYDSRDTSQSATMWSYSRDEVMKEEESDNCLAEIFGSWSLRTCAISNKCWSRMTGEGYNRYSLSHEIFYLEIAERFGCQMEMEWQMRAHLQPSLRTLQDMFCANMLAEANMIADNGYPVRDQDLFMEQAALCGMLGFRDFFNSEWLDKILSWQDPMDGCYRWAGWPVQRTGMGDVNGGSGSHVSRRRVKREEKRVAHGCLCHRTTVAASVLSQYVRFILEVWFQEQM